MEKLTDNCPMPFGKFGPDSMEPRTMANVPKRHLLFLWRRFNFTDIPLNKYQRSVYSYISRNMDAIKAGKTPNNIDMKFSIEENREVEAWFKNLLGSPQSDPLPTVNSGIYLIPINSGADKLRYVINVMVFAENQIEIIERLTLTPMIKGEAQKEWHYVTYNGVLNVPYGNAPSFIEEAKDRLINRMAQVVIDNKMVVFMGRGTPTDPIRYVFSVINPQSEIKIEG